MKGSRRRIADGGVIAVAIVAVGLVPFAGGCARDRTRQPVYDQRRPSYFSRAATLGSDMLRAPQGTTFPAAGLGVDLVERKGRPAPATDLAVGQARTDGHRDNPF